MFSYVLMTQNYKRFYKTTKGFYIISNHRKFYSFILYQLQKVIKLQKVLYISTTDYYIFICSTIHNHIFTIKVIYIYICVCVCARAGASLVHSQRHLAVGPECHDGGGVSAALQVQAEGYTSGKGGGGAAG